MLLQRNYGWRVHYMNIFIKIKRPNMLSNVWSIMSSNMSSKICSFSYAQKGVLNQDSRTIKYIKIQVHGMWHQDSRRACRDRYAAYSMLHQRCRIEVCRSLRRYSMCRSLTQSCPSHLLLLAHSNGVSWPVFLICFAVCVNLWLFRMMQNEIAYVSL